MKEVTFRILFKLLLKWSLGLRVGFRRGISADTPFGVHEYRNVMRNLSKLNTVWK
jgi:hypothetical protein